MERNEIACCVLLNAIACLTSQADLPRGHGLDGQLGDGHLWMRVTGPIGRRHTQYGYPGARQERESGAMRSRSLAGPLYPDDKDAGVVVGNGPYDRIGGITVFAYAGDGNLRR